MKNLSRAKLQHLLNAIHIINRVDDYNDFSSAVLEGMSRLIAADYINLHVLNTGNGNLIHAISPENPYTESEVAYYQAHSEENPLVAYYQHTQATHARRMSDVVTRKEYLSSGIYRYCNARPGIRYVLALPLKVTEETVAGLTFMRLNRDFSILDREALDAFAPHFLQAWLRHPAPWVVVGSDSVSSRQKFRKKLGLTTREVDVLYWVSEGKQNAEIAQILNISFYTVQKHVANILRKTGIENRFALTAESLKLRSRQA